MLACFFRGATYVPLSENLPPERIAYILKDSGARGVVACNEKVIVDTISKVKELMDDTFPPEFIIDSIDGLVSTSGPPSKVRVIDETFKKGIVIPSGDDVRKIYLMT